MSEISALWQRIEAWYEAQGALHLLNPGASAEAIAEAEKQLGLSFPAELKESLLRHDGTKPNGWPYDGQLLPVSEIVLVERCWHEFLVAGDFEDGEFCETNDGSDLVRKGWFVIGWIPISQDRLENIKVIDTVPGKKGIEGQILDVDHEGGPSNPEFSSLSAYLSKQAEILESGKFHVAEDCVERKR